MSERFVRIYKKFYVDEIKAHLMTYGALSGMCANCQSMDVKLDMPKCPSCDTPFKFIAFQNIRDHLPKMLRLHQEKPDIIFIDYDDFKKIEGEEKAKNILK